jgi:predicted AlkP superfamily phosphohydrolase/phosphomutase/Flp pilus assembly protein TadD
MRATGRLLAASLILALGLSSCGRGSGHGRVIVLGLDGLDPRAVDLLMSEGKMPNFAKLRQEGAYGRLQSAKPLLSPVVWTTIATGKTPDQHGIGHFVAIDDKTGEELPVTSGMRRVKALWNILSDKGRKVAVVGYWATWPAEKVNGVVVSDHTCYHFLFPQGQTGDAAAKQVTYPPELLAKIAPLVRRPADVSLAEASTFIRVDQEEYDRPFDFNRDVSHFRWALATAESYRAIGLKLFRDERPDLLMTYIEGTDSVAHLFGHLFRAGALSGELAEQQKKFGNAVEQMYLYADRVVGDYMAACDRDTTFVVLSDHGFDLGATQDDPSKTRDMRRVSEKFHNIEGILYLYGNHVKRGRLDQPRIIDVAPTVLALSGLAPAQDMGGRVLTEGLDLAVPGPAVATYETGPPAATSAARDATVNPEIVERLKSLGYMGGTASPAAGPGGADTGAPAMHSPKGERNLAAMHFEAGRFAEAAEAYARLVQQEPKDASLRTSLAGALGALGRYQEAMKELEIAIQLEPLNVEAYHNKAVIFERLGQKDAAIGQYRLAVRYSPQYEPSRRALERLTGSADVRAPRSDAQKRAAELAEAAGQSARRGDYAHAMKQLDEAEKIDPKSVLVQQYRSNVAYLSGDVPGAVRALEKALALEPDNALFKSNLARLRAQAATRPR